MLESRSAVLQQVRLDEERFEVRADKTLHYNDGSTRQYGVRVSVRNRSGRDFIVTADEARPNAMAGMGLRFEPDDDQRRQIDDLVRQAITEAHGGR